MKLIKAKIRGLGALAQSRWFEPSSHLNLFHFANPKYGKNFFRILQTINPTYILEAVKPFADFPGVTQKEGYTRRVNPAKRTVAFTVCGATPELVQELATAGDWLYETDRIEVGRRLDGSRWINFVELASSTRWSEISTDMQTLLDQARQLEPELTVPLADTLRTVQPSDRIKDDLQDTLAKWLQNLPPQLQKNARQLIKKTMNAVMRAVHFQAARDIVRKRLPLFVLLDGSDSASTFLDSLMHSVSDKAGFLGKQSTQDRQTFIEKLNNQLEKSPFPGKRLHINSSSGSLSLSFDGQPDPSAPGASLAAFMQLQAQVRLAVAFSRVIYQTEPILLFAGPEQAIPRKNHRELADFVIDVAKTCQCLYSFSDVDIFPNSAADRRYSAEDLSLAD